MTTISERHKHGGLGKYFTKEDIAGNLTKRLFEFLCSRGLMNSFEVVIEPSAGAGSFLKPMTVFDKPICAIDIDPASPAVEKMDFFEFKHVTPALFLGNPPFGHAAHLAVQFFNHATVNGAHVIAFILPKSFRKHSVQNRLHKQFHLELETDVPAKSFLLAGRECDVPSVFQVWVRRNATRSPQSNSSSAWIEFTHPEDAEYAMRRVGRRAGDLLGGLDHSRSTTHFFKIAHPDVLGIIRDSDEIKALSKNTAGVYSIGKSEIRNVVNRGMARRLGSPDAAS